MQRGIEKPAKRTRNEPVVLALTMRVRLPAALTVTVTRSCATKPVPLTTAGDIDVILTEGCVTAVFADAAVAETSTNVSTTPSFTPGIVTPLYASCGFAMAWKSRALSSTSASTPASSATSRSERPDAADSFTISAALS